jgi:hypothetical protein
VDLLRDLYAALQENRTFLHSRFGLGENSLEPYKDTIGRWMWPDPLSRDNPSPAKAKQAIAAYKHAVGDASGLADLMIFFCEQGTGFCADLGYQDENFMNSLWRMFEPTIRVIGELPRPEREPFLLRLHRVRDTAHKLGYGVGDAMDDILREHDDHPSRPAKQPRR